MTKPPLITPVEMSEQDIAFAERIAAKLGYSQTAYTSTSSLWGLFCLQDNPAHTTQHVFESSNESAFDSNCRKCGGKCRDSVHNIRLNYRAKGCLIKTVEFGFLFVADLEDLQLHDLADEARRAGV